MKPPNKEQLTQSRGGERRRGEERREGRNDRRGESVTTSKHAFRGSPTHSKNHSGLR